jgi:soluble lytic murein transglycosylase
VLIIIPVKNKLQFVFYPTKYSDFVNKYTDEFGVDKAFVYAVIKTESSFKPNAESNVGARGLMQLTQSAFDWVKFKSGFEGEFDDMFDPETNVKYGVYMLKLLLDEFKTESNALCAYHAGWGVTKEWLSSSVISPDLENIKNIPYSDTAWYVKTVLKARDVYNKMYFEKGE